MKDCFLDLIDIQNLLKSIKSNKNIHTLDISCPLSFDQKGAKEISSLFKNNQTILNLNIESRDKHN
jgi:hypothetical protein